MAIRNYSQFNSEWNRLDFLKNLDEADQLSINDIKNRIISMANIGNYWDLMSFKTLLDTLIEKLSMKD